MGLNIAVALVLYKKKLKEVPSIGMLKNLKATNFNIQIFVFDNSPSLDKEAFEDPHIRYLHDPSNPGLAKAYNVGIYWCSELGIDWMMLLDHDTLVDEDFIFKLYKTLDSDIENCAAIIPVIEANGRIISPVSKSAWNYHKPIHDTGIINRAITGINSATTIDVSFIRSIGGFSSLYPLDYLDHWFFTEIFKNQRTVLVLDYMIHQDLSIDNFSENVSLTRYESILKAKCLYYSDKGFISVNRLRISLIRDIVFHKLKKYDDGYSKLAAYYLRKL